MTLTCEPLQRVCCSCELEIATSRLNDAASAALSAAPLPYSLLNGRRNDTWGAPFRECGFHPGVSGASQGLTGCNYACVCLLCGTIGQQPDDLAQRTRAFCDPAHLWHVASFAI